MALQVPIPLQNIGTSAADERVLEAITSGIQAGVAGLNDYKVTFPGTGLQPTIANGYALVPATLGYYAAPNSGSPITAGVTGGANGHGSLPRIDSVFLKVSDRFDLGSATDGVQIIIHTGTPTASASLDNRLGAPGPPGLGEIRLADMFMGVNGTAYTNANTRDRRPWARGAYFAMNGNGGSNPTTSSTSYVSVGSAIFGSYPRIELNTLNSLEVSLHTTVSNSTAAAVTNSQVALSGTQVLPVHSSYHPTANGNVIVSQRRILAPGALAGGGFTSITPDVLLSVVSGTGTVNNANTTLSIREIILGTNQNGTL